MPQCYPCQEGKKSNCLEQLPSDGNGGGPHVLAKGKHTASLGPESWTLIGDLLVWFAPLIIFLY